MSGVNRPLRRLIPPKRTQQASREPRAPQKPPAAKEPAVVPPPAAKPATTSTDPLALAPELAKMSKSLLLIHAKRHDVEVPPPATKRTIIQALIDAGITK